MEIQDKLKILADSAKYDASCSSSGSTRKNTPGGIGACRDLSQLFCRRQMYFAFETSSHQLLHVRLSVLHKPHLERCSARVFYTARGCRPHHSFLQAELH